MSSDGPRLRFDRRTALVVGLVVGVVGCNDSEVAVQGARLWHQPMQPSVTTVAWSPSGDRLAAISEGSQLPRKLPGIDLWDTVGETFRPLPGGYTGCGWLAWNREGQLAFCEGFGEGIGLWDSSIDSMARLEVKGWSSDADWSADGNLLAVAMGVEADRDSAGSVAIWRKTGPTRAAGAVKMVLVDRGCVGGDKWVSVHPSGKWAAATCAKSGRGAIWDTENGLRIRVLDNRPIGRCRRPLPAAPTFGPDGETLYYYTAADSQDIIAVESWPQQAPPIIKKELRAPASVGLGGKLRIAPNGRVATLWTTAPPLEEDRKEAGLIVFNLDGEPTLRTTIVGPTTIDFMWYLDHQGIAFSPDSSSLALAIETALIWHVDSDTVRHIPSHPVRPSAATVTPDGQLLIGAYDNGTLVAYDTSDGRKRWVTNFDSLRPSEAEPETGSTTGKGAYDLFKKHASASDSLIALSLGRMVSLFDAATGAPCGGATGMVRERPEFSGGAEFSDDGARIAMPYGSMVEICAASCGPLPEKECKQVSVKPCSPSRVAFGAARELDVFDSRARCGTIHDESEGFDGTSNWDSGGFLVGVSPDGDLVAIDGRIPGASVFSLRTEPKKLIDWPSNRGFYRENALFSSDGNWVGGWDMANARLVPLVPGMPGRTFPAIAFAFGAAPPHAKGPADRTRVYVWTDDGITAWRLPSPEGRSPLLAWAGAAALGLAMGMLLNMRLGKRLLPPSLRNVR